MRRHRKEVPLSDMLPKSKAELIALAEERLSVYGLLSEDKQELILTPRQQNTTGNPARTHGIAHYLHRFVQHYITHRHMAYAEAYRKIVWAILRKVQGRRYALSHAIRPLQIRCSCGEMFRVRLDGRRWTRTRTDLAGVYRKSAGMRAAASVTVENLSRGGLRLRTHAPHTLSMNDVLTVQFLLDSGLRVDIDRPARVRYIQGCIVGVQFCVAPAEEGGVGLHLVP